MKLGMTRVMYTVRDLPAADPAALAYTLHWPCLVDTPGKKMSVSSSSQSVVERMRVNLVDSGGSACTGPTVVMDVSDVSVLTHFVAATKTYVTCVQGTDMLCMQNSARYAARDLGLKNRGHSHDVFLVGHSLGLAAGVFQGLGEVSLFSSLYVSTYKPASPQATYALFKEMCSQPCIPIAFHLHFMAIGSSQVRVAYTTNTQLTDMIYQDRIMQQPAMHMTSSRPGRHVFRGPATDCTDTPASAPVLCRHVFGATESVFADKASCTSLPHPPLPPPCLASLPVLSSNVYNDPISVCFDDLSAQDLAFFD